MTRLYVIGDIHGCYNEMIKMLVLIRDDAGDKPHKIVFLGDYIDRGPDSAAVIDHLIKISKENKNRYVFLKGNHDEMPFERGISGQSVWAMNGGIETIDSYKKDYPEIMNRNYFNMTEMFPEHAKFLKETQYNYVHRVAGRAVVCVHAGIDPKLLLVDQQEHTMVWSRNYVGYKGSYVNDYFVVHGHTPLKGQVLATENTLNIDTGCVFGYNLTCAVFEKQSIKPRYLTVKSEFEFK